MPTFTPHDINVVLGTFDYASSVMDSPEIGNTPAVTAVLNALDAQYQQSETAGRLREIPVTNHSVGEADDLLLLGGGCSACSDGEGRDLCIQSAQHDPGLPARFYLMMVESSGDQRSMTERKRQALFVERGIPLQRSHELRSDTDAPASKNEPQQKCDIQATHTQLSARNSLQTLFCNQEQQAWKSTSSLLVKIPITKENLQTVVQRERMKALCLTVRLQRNSFPPQPLARRDREMDIKIDVYYNGEFVKSAFVPNRAKQESNRGELVHRFHGKRVRLKGELPWLILTEGEPSGQGKEPGSRQGETAHAVDANERWKEISDLLRKESQNLEYGVGGKRTEIGRYLRALAELSLPSQVQERQAKTRRPFGSIDVMLTVGRGKKHGTRDRYLNEAKAMAIGAVEEMKDQIAPNTKAWREILQSGDAPATSSLPKPSHILAGLQEGPAFGGVRTSTRKRSTVFPAAAVEQKRKRTQEAPKPMSISQITPAPSPLQCGATLAGQLTAEELVQKIKKTAQRNAGSSDSSKPAEGNVDDCSNSAEQARSLDQSLSRSPADVVFARPCSSPGGDSSPLSSIDFSPLFGTDNPTAQNNTVLGAQRDAGRQQIKPVRTKQIDPSLKDEDWVSVTVHDNSVLSYPPDKLRQVRSERSGNFEESSILFGVRYVVF